MWSSRIIKGKCKHQQEPHHIGETVTNTSPKKSSDVLEGRILLLMRVRVENNIYIRIA
jgi:hypothetical protein